jgi:short-subunit dehydrogenase
MSSNKRQTIFITGATAGIGRHAALHFARHGHHVIASGRKLTALESLKAEATGLALDIVRLDVTSAESIAEAAKEALRLTGGAGIDVLINNAGYGIAVSMAEVSDADARAMFETNVFGLLSVTRAFLPGMLARRSGRILNVSSIGGRVTFPMFGVYNATKYAVEAMSDALRAEVAPFGVQVVLIEPGPIQTNFADRAMSQISEYRTPTSLYAAIYDRADELRAMTDKRAVSPDHVVRVMERAIHKRRPAARYMMPFSSRVLVWLWRSLPTRWVDAIARRVTGLTAKNLRVNAPAAEPAAEVYGSRAA